MDLEFEDFKQFCLQKYIPSLMRTMFLRKARLWRDTEVSCWSQIIRSCFWGVVWRIFETLSGSYVLKWSSRILNIVIYFQKRRIREKKGVYSNLIFNNWERFHTVKAYLNFFCIFIYRLQCSQTLNYTSEHWEIVLMNF